MKKLDREKREKFVIFIVIAISFSLITTNAARYRIAAGARKVHLSEFGLRFEIQFFKFGPFWSNFVRIFYTFPYLIATNTARYRSVLRVRISIWNPTTIQVWSLSNLISFKIILLKHFPQFNHNKCSMIKFIYSEKATKFSEISTNYLTGST